MKLRPMFGDPPQFLTDLSSIDPADDPKRRDGHGALPSVPELDVDVREQMIAGVHHEAGRCELLQDRHAENSAMVALCLVRGWRIAVTA